MPVPKGNPRRRFRRLRMMADVSDWNKKHEIGCGVVVTMDDGSEVETNTRSDAWLLSERSPVILLEGISGGYALSRVTPV